MADPVTKPSLSPCASPWTRCRQRLSAFSASSAAVKKSTAPEFEALTRRHEPEGDAIDDDPDDYDARDADGPAEGGNTDEPAAPAEESNMAGKMHALTCKTCGKAFRSKGAAAKWCSDACKAAAKGRQTPAPRERAFPRLPPPTSPVPNGELPSLTELRAAIGVVQRFVEGIGRMFGA